MLEALKGLPWNKTITLVKGKQEVSARVKEIKDFITNFLIEEPGLKVWLECREGKFILFTDLNYTVKTEFPDYDLVAPRDITLSEQRMLINGKEVVIPEQTVPNYFMHRLGLVQILSQDTPKIWTAKIVAPSGLTADSDNAASLKFTDKAGTATHVGTKDIEVFPCELTPLGFHPGTTARDDRWYVSYSLRDADEAEFESTLSSPEEVFQVVCDLPRFPLTDKAGNPLTRDFRGKKYQLKTPAECLCISEKGRLYQKIFLSKHLLP